MKSVCRLVAIGAVAMALVNYLAGRHDSVIYMMLLALWMNEVSKWDAS